MNKSIQANSGNLQSFVTSSETFNGFTFNGHYNMPEGIFIKLYNHYLTTGENYLDLYSELQYLLWEKKEGYDYVHDFAECDKLDQYVSIARRLKLMDHYDLMDIRSYIRECWIRYRDYLERKRNEPRRRACRFTAMPEVKKYVFSKYGKKCLCCGSEDHISLDHVIPINKGGKDEINNLQPLCKSCNSKKNVQIIDYR
jgi:hypothetical protein